MLKKVSLQNYRNLSLDLDIDSHANLIVAPNTSGKSNLLEAIYFASNAKTFRSLPNISDIIGKGSDYAKAEYQFNSQKLEIVISNTKRVERRFLLDGKRKPMGKIVGKFPSVLFAPHSVDIVGDDPSGRRTDLDDFLSLVDSQYAAQLKRYNKILKNRNAVLKHIRDHAADQRQINYWTEQLVELGSLIFLDRINFFEAIEPNLEEAAKLTFKNKGGTYKIEYVSKIPTEIEKYRDLLKAKFDDNRSKEIAAGQTLYGPHRDDYNIWLDEENLRYLGSRGQQRLAIFALKVGQYYHLKSKSDIQPTLLIDDLMSELDVTHRENVAKMLVEETDITFLLTAVDMLDVPDILVENSNRLKIVS